MIAFSDSSSFAPLADFYRNSSDARADFKALQHLAARGFGGVTLDLENPAETLAVLAQCKSLGFDAWLRVPLESHAVRWHFETHDVGATQAATWRAPANLQILSLAAAPLLPGKKPDWSRAVALHGLDADAQSSELERLAILEGARLWLWHQESENPLHDWPQFLPQFLSQCDAASVREIVRGLVQTPPTESETANSFPASPTLARNFAAQHGFDLSPRLPSLVADTGNDAARIRQQFWQTLARERETELRDLRALCAESGLQLRGALLQESPSRAIASLGDVPQALRALDVPGLAFSAAASPDDVLNARLAASVAELSGKIGALAQTVEDNGFSHRLLHCGITMFENREVQNQWQSDEDNAFISAARDFNRSLARMASALSQGRSGARIGVLWPQRSLQAHWHPRGHRIARWVEEDLHAVTQLLDELHFGFLLVPEDDLCAASIAKSTPENGCTLSCGAALHPFEMLVLPSVSTLSRAAWQKIEDFVEAGGKVVCLGLLPRWNEDGRDGEFETRVGKSTMMIVADLYAAYTQSEGGESGEDDGEASVIGFPIVRSKISGGRLGCYQPRLNADAADARLRVRQMIADALPPELESGAPDVLLSRRVCQSGELVFIVNAGDESQRVNVRVRPARDGAAFRCCLASGDVVPLGEWAELGAGEGDMDRGLALPLELKGGESELIWIEYDAQLPHAERANFTVESFDGQTMRGWATQSGVPLALVRENGVLVRWESTTVEVPEPIECNEWTQQFLPDGIALHSHAAVPHDWQNCRVHFEIEPALRAACELLVNGESAGACVAPPLCFDVTHLAGADETHDLTLKILAAPDFFDPREVPLGKGRARLVAHPIVEIGTP